MPPGARHGPNAQHSTALLIRAPGPAARPQPPTHPKPPPPLQHNYSQTFLKTMAQRDQENPWPEKLPQVFFNQGPYHR